MEKPIEDFYLRGSTVRSCKACRNEAARAARNNPRYWLWKRIARSKVQDITVDELEEALIQAAGVCPSCGRTERELCLDHDHQTGRYRGLLCQDCNMALGYLKDNPRVLRWLADYLENHGG